VDEVGISVVIAAISYLFGSISFARIISRLIAHDVDLNTVHLPNEDGSEGQLLQSVGATTASVKLGPRVGCTIGILDILKGVLPVLIIKLLYPEQYYFLIASVFVVVGHNWPVYYHFRGGSGVSPTYGGFFVVDFIGTIVCALAGMVFGFFIIRDILIAYTSGLWFFLLWMILFKGDWQYIVYAVVMNILFTIALIPDVKEYVRKKQKGQLDMRVGMESFPMGRGMLKIMKFFGVEPKQKSG
jgi:glycerol-3-phosphate acyltransferase PlsY